MNERRRAVGYIRVSTSEQAISALSLDAQRRKIDAQAEVSDLELVEVLEDAGVSASSLKRPGMCKLLAQVAAGQIDAVIIAKLDRLSRNIKDLAGLLEKMQKAKRSDGAKGIDLISASESFDTGSATGRLTVNVLASVSQWEREVVAERSRDALQELKAQGKSTGNPAYGFSAAEDGTLIPNEQEIAVLRRAEELREKDGLTWAAIAETLTRDGIRTRRGTAFSTQGIYHIARKAGIT